MVWQKINIGLFSTVLIIGGLGILFYPRTQISVFEKRALCRFPTFNRYNLTEGLYTDSLELFVADNFPFREALVETAYQIKDNLGFKSTDVIYYAANYDQEPGLNEESDSTENSSNEPDSIELNLPPLPDSAAGKSKGNQSEPDSQNEGEIPDIKDIGGATKSEGIVIYNNSAFQLFTGIKSIERYYAAMVNAYQKKLGDITNIYVAITPMSDEFYLPRKYKGHNGSHLKSINSIYRQIDNAVKKANVYDSLKAHTSEYLFFRSDHHWTGRGAFYAYKAFCSEAAIKTTEIIQLKRGVIKGFLGSLYTLTHNPDLKDNKDSVEYFKSNVSCKGVYFKDSVKGAGIPWKPYQEMARGVNAYGVFLGGDFGLLKLTTTNKTGRKALIIKNSYGNPFACYFIPDFDEIYVVDYRYFKGHIEDVVKTNKINHVVFCTPIQTANTRWHIKRMIKVL